MNKVKKIAIIGFGSIGKRHFKIVKKYKLAKEIKILTSQKKIPNKVLNFNSLVKFNPDLIIISSTTNTHLKYIKLIEKKFKNKKVLVEKPLFEKEYNYKVINNQYFIGYHFRFDPVINYIKKAIKNKKIFNVICQNYSYLPNWRKNRNYENTSSSQKKLGGGVLRDLSHELDFLTWIFGEINIKYAISNKISNLKINTDDNLLIHGFTKKVSELTLSTNFFSKILKRKIYVHGKNFHLEADLISKKLILYNNNELIKKKWSVNNYEMNYLKQLKEIIKPNNKISTNYNEGLKIMKLIKKIEKFR